MIKKILFLIAISAFLSGCITTEKRIDITTTRLWEGHYMTVEDFTNATSNITLEKGVSIWVMSNDTLYSILKKKEQ